MMNIQSDQTFAVKASEIFIAYTWNKIYDPSFMKWLEILKSNFGVIIDPDFHKSGWWTFRVATTLWNSMISPYLKLGFWVIVPCVKKRSLQFYKHFTIRWKKSASFLSFSMDLFVLWTRSRKRVESTKKSLSDFCCFDCVLTERKERIIK